MGWTIATVTASHPVTPRCRDPRFHCRGDFRVAREMLLGLGMTRTLLSVVGLLVCSGCAVEVDDPVVDAPGDTASSWAPFVYGESSDGEIGRARFQIAACAHPEGPELVGSCHLDEPWDVGHRTAVLVDWPDGDLSAVRAVVPDEAVVVEGAAMVGEYLRVRLTAVRPGEATLALEDADGAMVDCKGIEVFAED